MLLEAEFFGVATFLSAIGIGFCILLLVFNMKYRHLRFVRMTSPSVNMMVVCGGALGYASTSLLSFSHSNPRVQEAVMMSVTWVLPISLSMIFGGMFAKAWRVHRLFEQSSLKRVRIHDCKLFQIIGVLVLIDIIIAINWLLVDPIRCHTVDTVTIAKSDTDTPQESPSDSAATLTPTQCSSIHHHVWLATIYIYKHFLFLAVSMVAWKIRLVNFPSLDDGRTSLVSAQSAALLSSCAVGLAYVLQAEHPLVVSVLICVALYAGVTVSMAFTFLPKVYQVLKRTGNNDQPPSYVGARYIDEISNGNFEMEIYRILSENENLRKQLYEKENLIVTMKKASVSDSDDAECRNSQSSHVFSLSSGSGHHTHSSSNVKGSLASSSHSYAKENGGLPTDKSVNIVYNKHEKDTSCCQIKNIIKYCCVANVSQDIKPPNQCVIPTVTQNNYESHRDISNSLKQQYNVHDPKMSGEPYGHGTQVVTPSGLLMPYNHGDLIGSIADTFQLPDDSDTHSYISSYISRSHYKYKHRNRQRNCETDYKRQYKSANMLVSANDQGLQLPLSCDQLYPDSDGDARMQSDIAKNQDRRRLREAMYRCRDSYNMSMEKGDVTLV